MDKSEALEALEQARFHIKQIKDITYYSLIPGTLHGTPIGNKLSEILVELEKELKELETDLRNQGVL